MRDPRKLKFIAAMGSQGQTNESKVLEESNTLRIQNISNKFTAVMICEMFSLYGSIYSCRLLNDQNIAYVAFTKTEYAKDALENLNEKIFDGLEIKLSYAPKIICNGQVLLGIILIFKTLEANQSEQITGLPFNAQFVKTSGILFPNFLKYYSFSSKTKTNQFRKLKLLSRSLLLTNGKLFTKLFNVFLNMGLIMKKD